MIQEKGLSRLTAGGIIFPLVRSLPVVFAYAEGLERLPQAAGKKASLRSEFRAHLKVLIETLETIPANSIDAEAKEPILAAAHRLLEPIRKGTCWLVPEINSLIKELESFSETHRAELRKINKESPDLLREPYERLVSTRVIGLVEYERHAEQTRRLKATLQSRCQYTVVSIEPYRLPNGAGRCSAIGFAPTEENIPGELLDRALALERPVLAFLRSHRASQKTDVTAHRGAYGMERRGVHLIHPPHNAMRLIQKLDRIEVPDSWLFLSDPRVLVPSTALRPEEK